LPTMSTDGNYLKQSNNKQLRGFKRWIISKSHLFLCLNLILQCHHHLIHYHHIYH
jgi:hypothetical protein